MRGNAGRCQPLRGKDLLGNPRFILNREVHAYSRPGSPLQC
jgi:hypothetical protein